MTVDRLAVARDALARGWALTPLRGKVPYLDAWQRAPIATLDQVSAWIAENKNLGLRTGIVSGVLVVDVDTVKGGKIELPATVQAITGSGGAHYYFRHIEGFGNSASKLAPHVDTRGEGGQVVFVGSLHPNTGKEYAWAPGRAPGEIEIADLPKDLAEKLREARVRIDMTAPLPELPATDANRVLVKIAAQLRSATEGSRNDQLNKAAFTAGKLVGNGSLIESDAVAELTAAATMTGLGSREIAATIRSGINAGRLVPWVEKLRISRPSVARPIIKDENTGHYQVLCHGTHWMSEEEGYRHVTTHDYASTVLAMLPEGTVCIRGGLPGRLLGAPGSRSFHELGDHAARMVVDSNLESVELRAPKADSEATTPTVIRRNTTVDSAKLVLGRCEDCEDVRELEALVAHPAISPEFSALKPGWSSSGLYYDEPPSLRGLEPERDAATIQAVLDDLVVDFPFQEPGDREAFFALLLTPLLRPAMGGVSPLFLISSPQERTGKTKLVELVLGGIVLGRPVPALQLGSVPEEHDKRITAHLLSGHEIAHLDNLAEYTDSPALSSLMTANVYQGRLLGVSTIVTMPNRVTLVATGNNPKFSSELAKRILPIRLLTRDERPEARRDFKHPDLKAYVLAQRRPVLGALMGMIGHWLCEGRPSGERPFGGFEQWIATVGGVLASHARRLGGQGSLLGSAQAWVDAQDDREADFAMLAREWAARAVLGQVDEKLSAMQLWDLAKNVGVFSSVETDSAKGTQSRWGKELQRLAGRISEERRLTVSGSGTHRAYRLVDEREGGKVKSDLAKHLAAT